MGAAACGERGFKGRARVRGERPIGAARRRQQHNQASCPPPPVWPFLVHKSLGPRPRAASEGKGPQRWPQKRLDRRLEEVAEAVGGRLLSGQGRAGQGGGGCSAHVCACHTMHHPRPPMMWCTAAADGWWARTRARPNTPTSLSLLRRPLQVRVLYTPDPLLTIACAVMELTAGAPAGALRLCARDVLLCTPKTHPDDLAVFLADAIHSPELPRAVVDAHLLPRPLQLQICDAVTRHHTNVAVVHADPRCAVASRFGADAADESAAPDDAAMAALLPRLLRAKAFAVTGDGKSNAVRRYAAATGRALVTHPLRDAVAPYDVAVPLDDLSRAAAAPEPSGAGQWDVSALEQVLPDAPAAQLQAAMDLALGDVQDAANFVMAGVVGADAAPAPAPPSEAPAPGHATLVHYRISSTTGLCPAPCLSGNGLAAGRTLPEGLSPWLPNGTGHSHLRRRSGVEWNGAGVTNGGARPGRHGEGRRGRGGGLGLGLASGPDREAHRPPGVTHGAPDDSAYPPAARRRCGCGGGGKGGGTG